MTCMNTRTNAVTKNAMIWLSVRLEKSIPTAMPAEEKRNSPRYPAQTGPQSRAPRCHGQMNIAMGYASVATRRMTIMTRAARYFPRITSASVTGSVMRSSIVPARVSSARARIVMSGMTRNENAQGMNSNMRPIVTRSTCQKPPPCQRKK